jgi:glycine cleavage system H protein
MASVDNSAIPNDARLTESHEFIRVDDDRARIGISHIAAERLGDIVYIELPEVGQSIEKGETFGSIESVKAASDLYMPVSGEIIGVNTQLSSELELIANDPYGDGWMLEVVLSNPAELDALMEGSQYLKFVEENEGL